MTLGISDNAAKWIRQAGYFLCALGLSLAAWSYFHFSDLYNYQRLAILFPLSASFPMIWIDDYRKGFPGLSGHVIGKMIAMPIGAVVLLLGAVYWYVNDPSAKS